MSQTQATDHSSQTEYVSVAENLAYVIDEALKRAREEQEAEKNRVYTAPLTLVANAALATWSTWHGHENKFK